MLSLQEADANLQLFSAVNYISFYSFRVLHWREICETRHAGLVSYCTAKPWKQFILTYVSSWSQLTAVSLQA